MYTQNMSPLWGLGSSLQRFTINTGPGVLANFLKAMILDNKNTVYDVRFPKAEKKLRLKRPVSAIFLFINIIFFLELGDLYDKSATLYFFSKVFTEPGYAKKTFATDSH